MQQNDAIFSRGFIRNLNYIKRNDLTLTLVSGQRSLLNLFVIYNYRNIRSRMFSKSDFHNNLEKNWLRSKKNSSKLCQTAHELLENY